MPRIVMLLYDAGPTPDDETPAVLRTASIRSTACCDFSIASGMTDTVIGMSRILALRKLPDCAVSVPNWLLRSPGTTRSSVGGLSLSALAAWPPEAAWGGASAD